MEWMLAMTAACCMVLALPAAAYGFADSAPTPSPPSPLEQIARGADPAGVDCRDGLILMASPSLRPACVSEASASVLAGRGWGVAGPVGGEAGSAPPGKDRTSAADADAADPARAIPAATASAPFMPLVHPTTIAVSHYPVVGETANVTFAVTFDAAKYVPTMDGPNPPLANPHLVLGHHKYRVFNVVSNIGTGDPDVFVPYDPDAVTTVAEDGVTYTLKAQFVVLKEAYAVISGNGFGTDFAEVSIAAGANRSMSAYEYKRTGQTYLDSAIAAELAAYEQKEPSFQVDDEPIERDPSEMWITGAGAYEAMLRDLSADFIASNYSESDILGELAEVGFERQAIADLFSHLNYTKERLEALPISEALAAYYRDEEYDGDSIVRDMLQRNYTETEAIDFLRSHMNYTDEQIETLRKSMGVKNIW